MSQNNILACPLSEGNCYINAINQTSSSQFQVNWECYNGSYFSFLCVYTLQSFHPATISPNCIWLYSSSAYNILGSDLSYIVADNMIGTESQSFAYLLNRTDLSVVAHFSGTPDFNMGNGLTLNNLLYRNNYTSQQWQMMLPNNWDIYVYGDYVFLSNFGQYAEIFSPTSQPLSISFPQLTQYDFLSFAYNPQFSGGFYFALAPSSYSFLSVYNALGDEIMSVQNIDLLGAMVIISEHGVYLYYKDTSYVGYNWQGKSMASGKLDSCAQNSIKIANGSCIACLNIESSMMMLFNGMNQELIWSNPIPLEALMLALAYVNFNPMQIDPQTGQIEYYSITVCEQGEYIIFGADGQNYTIQNPQNMIAYPNGLIYTYALATQNLDPAVKGQIYRVTSFDSPYNQPASSSSSTLGLWTFLLTFLIVAGISFQTLIKYRLKKIFNKEKILESIELPIVTLNPKKPVQELAWIPWLDEKYWARSKIIFIAGTGFFFSASLYGKTLFPFFEDYYQIMGAVQEFSGLDDLPIFLYVFFPVTAILSLLSLTLMNPSWREKLPFNLCIHMIITIRIAVTIRSVLVIGPHDLTNDNMAYLYPHYDYWPFMVASYWAGIIFLAIITLISPFLSLSKLKNHDLVFNEIRNRIEKVNANQLPHLDVDDKVIRYCDLVGRSTFFSFRNLTILTSIVPGIVNLFLSKGTLQPNLCIGHDYTYHLLSTDDCQLSMDALHVSYSVSIWSSSPVSFATLLLISMFLFTMLKSIILLHKYRAKFFAGRVKFTDQMTMVDIVKDIAWNAMITYMLIYVILDQVNEAIPSGLTAQSFDNDGIQFSGAKIGNPLNYTNGTGFTYDNLYSSFQSEVSLFGPISFVALLGSLFGLMFHSKSAVLLSFFRERDLLILASVSDLKIKYEVPNDCNQTLKFIREVYLLFPKESARTKITALMSYFEDVGMMKEVEMTMKNWDPDAYFEFKQK